VGVSVGGAWCTGAGCGCCVRAGCSG
jgi:hypothetical protein